MVDIKSSVGRGGKNAEADVRTIQHLINTNIGAIDPMAPLKADGKCGNQTIAAIEEFQRRSLNMSAPDGLITPTCSTMRVLKNSLGAMPTQSFTDPPWLRVAQGEEGTKEAAGLANNNPRILEYIATFPYLAKVDYLKNHVKTGYKMGQVDETAWCACFVNWCLKQAGKAGGPNARAQDWQTYGSALPGPKVGAITILNRPPFNDTASGWHIGFWIGGPSGAPILLGGNQNNSVCRKQFIDLDRLIYRWPA